MPRHAIYIFQRGQEILIPITDSAATPGDAPLVVAKMRKLDNGNNELVEADPVAATFTTYYRESDPDLEKGWNFVVASANSAALDADTYQFNFSVTEGGTIVWKSDRAIVKIEEPA